MIKSITFKNFKALRDCTLPLGRFTLLVGPNGCGKSTVLQAMMIVARNQMFHLPDVISAECRGDVNGIAGFTIDWDASNDGPVSTVRYRTRAEWREHSAAPQAFTRMEAYSLAAEHIAAPVQLQPNMALQQNGRDLAGVLDRLRDQHPERWEKLNTELAKWFPEFDCILFDTPQTGHRAIRLRMSACGQSIPASDLSQGTLLALAMLTLAYLPDPPPVVAFEEPDRGIHPRLLRDVRDAMYRLAYPESVGEDRPPVQVIATTHSPYMLDLFKDHPEEIVIAQKLDDNVRFDRLSDLPHIEEILESAPLGEVWYSGILGGAPAGK